MQLVWLGFEQNDTQPRNDLSLLMQTQRLLGMPVRRAVWVVTVAILVLLFLIWPYSSWSFMARNSILVGLAKTVYADPEWMFCIAVPFLVAYIVWRKRTELATLPLEGEWWGLGLLSVGALAYWVGYKVDTSYPGYAAAQLISAGLIILFGGRRWMRALGFAWVFLIFTWPMYPLEDRISFPLRMLMAKTSSVAINLMGINAVREGTAIYSAMDVAAGLKQGAKFMLDVDAPCAGMRSLFALVMITFIYAYLSLRGLWKRVFLVLCSVPLALLGNVVRMMMLAAGSVLWGVDFAVGRNINGEQEISTFHEMAGYTVFAVALGGMFAISGLLERRAKKKTAPLAPLGDEPLGTAAVVGPRLYAALGVVCLTLTLCGFIGGQPPLGAPGVQEALPLRIGNFQGWQGEADQRELNMLAEDVKIMRNYYILGGGANAMCSVVLSGAERRSLHRPEVCLPAQGWNVIDKSVTTLHSEDNRDVDVMLVRMLRDFAGPDGKARRVRALNVFFYVGSEGVTTPDYYDHVYKSYLHSLTRNINHRWALVSFYMPFSETEVGQDNPMVELGAIEELREFVAKAIPVILKPAM